MDLQQISFSCRWESGLRWPAMLQRGDEDLQVEVLQPQVLQQQVDVEKYLLSGQWSWRYSVIPLEGSEEAVDKKLEHWGD